jgi:HD-GYP domain-containing protein (c-di-GMP phosphodiesterase class II)
MAHRTAHSGRRLSLANQAKALTVILREEFDVAFVCYDAATGVRIGFPDTPEIGDTWVALDAATVIELAAGGRARVTPLAYGRFQLAIPIYEYGKPVLVAIAAVPALAPTGPPAAQEQVRLQKWAQAVCDRLRGSDQLLCQRRQEEEHKAQVKIAWEVILTLDHLIRHLRIHKSPAKNQQRILEAAYELLGAQTVIWIPQDSDAAVQVQGECCLAPADCRQLMACVAKMPERDETGLLLCNDIQSKSWGIRFPNLRNLLAFAIIDQKHVIGWVIALNKLESVGEGQSARAAERSGEADVQEAASPGALVGAPSSASPTPPLSHFRRSDAALLTPFVALLGLHARGSGNYQDIKNLLVGLTRSLTSALDAKDSYTYGHSERVARIAVELGRELDLEEDEIGDIYLTGLLHDIGKIGVSDAVLGKRERLSPAEFEQIKQHVTIGYSILVDLRQIRNLLPGVLYHHEHYDGSGYPDGLVGEKIPLLARILAVADAYDAMSTTRPYRPAMPYERVEEILAQGAGKQWDKRIIEACLRCRHKIHAIRQRGVGESLRQAIDGVLRNDHSSILSIASAPLPLQGERVGN